MENWGGPPSRISASLERLNSIDSKEHEVGFNSSDDNRNEEINAPLQVFSTTASPINATLLRHDE